MNGPIAGGGGSPQKALGKKTADALDSAGPEGEQVAQLAAEAAPEEAAPSEAASGGGKDSGSDGKKQDQQGGNAAGGGKGSGGNGGGSTGNGGANAKPSAGGNPSLTAASGDSAAGQVASYATLSSSGSMGIFLPLILLAALAWAIFYAWRRHQRDDAAATGA